MFQSKIGHSQHTPADISLESCINNNAQDETVVSHRTTININQSQSDSILINGASVHMNNTILDAETLTQNNTLETNSNVKLEDEGLMIFGPVEMRKNLSTRDPSEIDNSNVNFSQNREQWQRRANSQSHIKIPQTPKMNRHSEMWHHRQNHTPDLVMDLPLVGNSSPKETTKKSISMSANLYSENSLEDDTVSTKSAESPTGPESPDMTTAAERFAKQNQCTLKKNTKIHIEGDGSMDANNTVSDLIAIPSPVPDRKLNNVPESTTSTSTFKPQIKAKPPVLKKPVFCVPLHAASQEVLPKDQSELT